MFSIITSVNGVGTVTATQILITTNEFKDIKDPKKFACYAGVAPFTKESGVFKGKARVSHMANKKVKTLLHMSALTAITYNPDMKLYYDRKVNEEKKNKMLVINAVRNKPILHIFACINQNRKYEKNYTRLVACIIEILTVQHLSGMKARTVQRRHRRSGHLLPKRQNTLNLHDKLQS